MSVNEELALVKIDATAEKEFVPDFNPEPISVSCSVSCSWRLVQG